MPNTPIIKGDNTVLFGSGGVYATGLITSGSKKTGAEKILVQDNTGFTIAAIYFDNNNECQFEMIVQTAAPAFAIGDQITICGVVNCLIEDFEEKWAQKDVRKFSVTAKKYAGMTLV